MITFTCPALSSAPAPKYPFNPPCSKNFYFDHRICSSQGKSMLRQAGWAPQGSLAASASGVPDTVGIGHEETRQVTPHELWTWNANTHWKHWHGIWVYYQPLESPNVAKTYRSVRSLRAVDEKRTHLFHRNQWYSFSGDGEEVEWEFGPWEMHEETHSLSNGILHPNNKDLRILQFPNGDLGWVQLALKPDDPKCVVFGEVHFMLPEQNARIPVVAGYDHEGKLLVAQMLEETLQSDERPDPSWKGTIFKHHRSPIEKSREEPKGTYFGTEMILTPELTLITREALWTGFKGGLSGEEAESYSLIHLPYNFTAWVPSKAAIGKDHAFVVNWLVSEEEIRRMSWRYGDGGKLQYVKTGSYKKISDPDSDLKGEGSVNL